ncbi:hypothetical protein Ping_0200 [Psychromonas ingrahamii 37]|uniref:Uncharacterized protein n=1 Tax=Psychromonas ingrahamii (strain DSM 17664 / CCUG 51855 / 37) TaxID=357804 RepID=A1SRF3_PSYIN|nr:hypothetical protein [Psychromonas ingrahamii]ABM02068.1 hypothetical protein Ping_0200 [Psychromonas ingrahamii 37]
MQNTHCLEHLPSQDAIDLIADYHHELKQKNLNYQHLLEKLKKDLCRLGFMLNVDNKIWMETRGNDYLRNPKLFNYAPLTCICAVLSEIFKEDDLAELAEKLPAITLKKALLRLNEFK